MSLFSFNLDENEELLTIIRKHWATFSGKMLQFLIILVIIFAFNKFIPGDEWKRIVVMIALIFAFGFLVYNFILWYLVSIVVTDKKIIDLNQKTLSKRSVTEVLIEDIGQVQSIKEGFWENFLNYGTLVIEIKGGGKIAGFGVKNPQFLMSNLNKLKRDYNETLSNTKGRAE
ncbi:MAG: hypothetical protein GF347_00800 [Candidatus Moranbacteria bacterium]|nr:hypothetical protein [Candidatus Moranbacteria bacterium]